jgi:ubiquinone/menaquinone biosynthesis C-methylase UbiE
LPPPPHTHTILEAGIGEGNFLGELLPFFTDQIIAYGFDISWSRVACARDYFRKKRLEKVNLVTGDLTKIPFLDNSIEFVFTNQAIEPNHGNEEVIIKELYRITSKYLILIEPAYELANKQAKERMERHGYVRNLEKIIRSLNMKIIEYKLFPYPFHELNPVAIIIIEKKCSSIVNKYDECVYADPIFHSPLSNISGSYYSSDSLRIYPIINGIPCLRLENGIVASKYQAYLE